MKLVSTTLLGHIGHVKLASMNKKSKADTSDTSTANKTITELLQSMSSKGRLKHLDEWRDINLNLDNIGQKQSVRNVLELCQCVCTREEMNTVEHAA
jgi:hypothetical protein